MKIYNTLSRKIEQFKPQQKSEVKIYTCGPTVYDRLHVGNWAIFIRWDMLARILQANGYHLNWIMNITDVGHLVSDADEGEDKLEKGAKREGKTAWEIAKMYSDDFIKGLRALDISIPQDHLPKATDYIDEQIAMIKTLEDKGYTYKIDDGVYFDTAKVDNYGKLSRASIKGQKARARVAVNPKKRNSTDFALWKFSPEGKKRDMEWVSPWGRGFPGWHLECSALAKRFLGDTLDIHAGGEDHIPIHHINEIAQSEAANGKKMANFWLHSSFITVSGTKISKSLGNGYTLEDIAKHGFSPMDFRTLVLQSHYRTHADFSWEALESAKNRLTGLQAFADLRFQKTSGDKVNLQALNAAKESIIAALSDDLATPQALAILSKLETECQEHGLDVADKQFTKFVVWLDEIFGLNLSKSTDLKHSQLALLEEREAARKQKDWNKADQLREELNQQGIAVNDTERGQIWSRS